MSDWFPGPSAVSTPTKVLFLLLLVLPLWVGATSELARLVLCSGCLVFLLLVLHQQERLYRPPGLIPLALFCLWMLLQLVPLPPALLRLLMPGYVSQLEQGVWLLSGEGWHSISLHPAATFAEFLRYSAYAFFYIGCANLLVSIREQKKLLLWLFGFFGIYSFLGMMQFFAPNGKIFWFFSEWPETTRYFATYVNANHYAGLIGMVFPVLLVGMLVNIPHAGYGTWRERLVDLFTDSELHRSFLLGLVAILAAVSVFFSLSRSGTVSMFLSTLLLLILLAGRERLGGRLMASLVVLVAAVGLLIFFGWEPLFERFAKPFENGGFESQRVSVWFDSLNLFYAAPLVGSGAGSFLDAYPAWQTVVTKDLVIDHAHNDYLELLTDVGLVGFLLVFVFWLRFLRVVIQEWRKRSNPSSRLLCAAYIAGLSAIFLHSVTDFNLAIPANGLYFFLLISLLAAASHSRTARRQKKSELPLFSAQGRRRLRVGAYSVLALVVIGAGGTEFANLTFKDASMLNLAAADGAQLVDIANSANTASVLAPLQPVYPFAAGMVLGQQGDLEPSLEKHKKAVWLRPLHVEYQLQSARTLFALGRESLAEALLRNAFLINPYSWSARQELASFYLASERLAEGLEIYRDGLQTRPDKTSEVIRALLLEGVARTDFFTAMPQRSFSWMTLGNFFRGLDNLKQANIAYRNGVDALKNEANPQADIFWKYLEIMDEQKRNAEALELLRTALEHFPQNQYFLSRQGMIYERENLRDRAIESFRASLLIDPSRHWVRERLKKLEAYSADKESI